MNFILLDRRQRLSGEWTHWHNYLRYYLVCRHAYIGAGSARRTNLCSVYTARLVRGHAERIEEKRLAKPASSTSCGIATERAHTREEQTIERRGVAIARASSTIA